MTSRFLRETVRFDAGQKLLTLLVWIPCSATSLGENPVLGGLRETDAVHPWRNRRHQRARNRMRVLTRPVLVRDCCSRGAHSSHMHPIVSHAIRDTIVTDRNWGSCPQHAREWMPRYVLEG